MVKEEKEYSGNLRIRVPRTMHQLLAESAEYQGVSLNQLCLYLLAKGMHSNLSNNMSREGFNLELYKMLMDCSNDESNLYKRVSELLEKVRLLIPLLLHDLKDIYDNNNGIIPKQEISVLEEKYPVFEDCIWGTMFPIFKLPTVKMVLTPKDLNNRLDYCEIKTKAERISEYADVSAINNHIFITDYHITDEDKNSIVIHIFSEDFWEVHEKLDEIRYKIVDNTMNVKMQPSYMFISISRLFQQKYIDND